MTSRRELTVIRVVGRINVVSVLDSQNRERVASKVHRQETLDGLKKFNARRKLKVCVFI